MALLSSLITSAFTGPTGATGPNLYEKSTNPTITSNILTLDLSSATEFNVTLDNNISTMTISNPSSSGNVSSFIVRLQYTASTYTVAWNAAIKWPSNAAPTLTNSNGKSDVFSFFTTDGGTTYYGFISGQNL